MCVWGGGGGGRGGGGGVCGRYKIIVFFGQDGFHPYNTCKIFLKN